VTQITRRQRWSALCVCWVLAGCGAPLQQPPISEAPTPPLPGAIWAPPEPVPAEPGNFAWSEVHVQTACPREAASVAVSPRVIASAAQFESAYCQKPQLDFGRFRLVVFDVAHPAVDVDVVPNADAITVIVQTRQGCDAGWEAPLALLLPAGPKPAVLIERPVPAPDCRDGYGY
jgi:hypothetical protein